MNPRDFLNFVRELLQNESIFDDLNTEALYRTSIGRCYYSVLHDLIKKMNIFVPGEKLRTFHSYVTEKIEDFADDLVLMDFHFLKDMRVTADYELDAKVRKREVSRCLKAAGRIMKHIDEKPEYFSTF